MSCKKIKAGKLVCAVALGLVSVSPAVQAQTDMTTMSGSSTMSMSQPTLVTGTVLRYYVDRSGYVTAMDVQTSEGVQFVRFSPGMGSRLYSTYPVGGTASVYVMGSPTSRWDVVGMGTTAPAPGTMMQAYTVTDAELLESEPYIMAGAKMVGMTGKLTDIIVSDRGEVVGLVLDGASMKMKKMKKMKMKGDAMMSTTSADGTTVTSSTTTSGNTTTTVTDTTTVMTTGDSNAAMMNSMGMMPGSGGVLVRVPREFRHIAPGYAGTDRVTPLFKGAIVEVTGYPEVTRFGALDVYGQRIAANALVVNGRAVGALGVPMMTTKASRALFRNVDIGGAGRSAEEMRASGMGYTVYGTSNTMGSDPAMTTNTTMMGTTGDTTMR